MEEDIIVLHDEDGTEIECEVLDVIEYQGDEYVVLIPTDAPEDDPVHILRIVNENLDKDEARYEGLDDDGLIEAIYKQFCKRNGL